ncbi:hypothetical protein MRX96_054456 [Rhipicephalus microplus]
MRDGLLRRAEHVRKTTGNRGPNHFLSVFSLLPSRESSEKTTNRAATVGPVLAGYEFSPLHQTDGKKRKEASPTSPPTGACRFAPDANARCHLSHGCWSTASELSSDKGQGHVNVINDVRKFWNLGIPSQPPKAVLNTTTT